MHLLPSPRDQEAAPIPPAAQPAGCNLSPPLQTPASSETLEKLCPLRTQWANFTRGCGGHQRDGSRGQPLPGAVARERPEPWPGAVPAACRGRHAGQRRPERGSRSPAAHAPPLGWSHRGAEPPLPARPPRPQLGPPPRPPVPACPPPACRARRRRLITWPRPPPAPGGNLKLLRLRRPLPPRGGDRSPRLSSRGGHRVGPAGPGQGCTLAAAPARPGGLHALVAPEEGAGLSAPKGSSARP
ncbi:hypothetical protein NN561_006501 [Cricetulus griseus]